MISMGDIQITVEERKQKKKPMDISISHLNVQP